MKPIKREKPRTDAAKAVEQIFNTMGFKGVVVKSKKHKAVLHRQQQED